LSNLADIIEQFILRRLSAENSDIVILKRNELADEIECAPSQISYVLSTRFTTEKGFIVESRRGLGGFIRIARLVAPATLYEKVAAEIDEDTPLDDILAIVEYWQSHNLLSAREAALITQYCAMLYDFVVPDRRVPLLRMIFITLGNH